jgi:hypothetical protein
MNLIARLPLGGLFLPAKELSFARGNSAISADCMPSPRYHSDEMAEIIRVFLTVVFGTEDAIATGNVSCSRRAAEAKQ